MDSLALASIVKKISEYSLELIVPLCEKAVALYKGPFLPADTGQAWSVSTRETLKNRLLRVILSAGCYLEQSGEWERAAEHYSKGIEIDRQAEELYWRLMVCYRSLGNNADVAKTFNRCRSLLWSELGIEPSPDTIAVYTAIIQKQ